MEILLTTNPDDSGGKNYILLLIGFLLSIGLTFSFSAIGDKYLPIIFISSLPLIFVFSFNFRLTYCILIVSLFINLHFQWLSSAIWLAILVPISYIIGFKNIKLKEFNLPITISLLIYLFTMFLSLKNSVDLLFSLYLMYNMVAFVMILYFSVASIRSKKEVLTYIILFLIFNIFNSFHVLFDGLTSSKRAFGFAGVMFVDYVGLAITMNFILLLTSRRKNYRLLLVVSLILFVIALLITQTRNAWISTFLSLFLLMIFLIIMSQKFNMRRLLLVTMLVASVVVISSLVLVVTSVNPEVGERAQQTTEIDESIDHTGAVKSSLVMRFFIWHTAYMAFVEHTVFGIGAYSFPFSSFQYYTIPRFLFDTYVEGRTPHITYLAVAVETGVVGLLGFLIFLFASLKFSFDGIRYSKSFEESSFSLLLFWPLIYIIISMLMTDAWLWGQGLILWAILLGFNLWNSKTLKQKYLLENSAALKNQHAL